MIWRSRATELQLLWVDFACIELKTIECLLTEYNRDDRMNNLAQLQYWLDDRVGRLQPTTKTPTKKYLEAINIHISYAVTAMSHIDGWFDVGERRGWT